MDENTTTNAATIDASIDLATVAGHNLRALLLRVQDGDDWKQGGCADALRLAATAACRKLLAVEMRASLSFELTPLGREVAERLRPVPWVAVDAFCLRTEWVVCMFGRDGFIATCEEESDAERIASLLTDADIRAAKAYKTEADHV